MTCAYRCGRCDGEPHWRIERQGDAVISWACGDHLDAECDRLQRDWEVTRLMLIHWGKRREHAEIDRALRGIADGYGRTRTEDSGQRAPASGLRLSSSDPQPPTGTVVVDDSGTTWINTGDHPCPWVPYRHDGDPESWTKVAGNYGPVTVQRHGTA